MEMRQEDFEDGTGMHLLALRLREIPWIDPIHIFLKMLHFPLQCTTTLLTYMLVMITFANVKQFGDKEIPCPGQKGCVIYCITSFPKFCTVKEYRGCEVKLCMSKVLALDGRE
jgi:hypothetical protein